MSAKGRRRGIEERRESKGVEERKERKEKENCDNSMIIMIAITVTTITITITPHIDQGGVLAGVDESECCGRLGEPARWVQAV